MNKIYLYRLSPLVIIFNISHNLSSKKHFLCLEMGKFFMFHLSLFLFYIYIFWDVVHVKSGKSLRIKIVISKCSWLWVFVFFSFPLLLLFLCKISNKKRMNAFKVSLNHELLIFCCFYFKSQKPRYFQ